MYCQACGAENTADARFCNMCGARFAQAGEAGGPLGSDTEPDRAPVAPAQRNAPEATVLGVGQADLAKKTAGTAPIIHAPAPAAAQTGQTGPMAQGPNPFGGDSMLGVTLGGIGVKSAKKTWATIVFIAVALIAAGSLATWLAMRGTDDAGHAEADDPMVLGIPLTDETDTESQAPTEDREPTDEEIDFISGAGGSTASAMRGGSSGSSGSSSMQTASAGSSSSMSSGSGSSGSSGDRASAGSSSMGSTGSGSSGSSASGSSGSGSTGSTSAGSGSTGSGSTGSGSTGSGSAGSGSTGSGGTDTAGSTGGGSLPSNLEEGGMEERDLELELYGSRVRYVVRRYYAARAQACFDRATRNDPTISGTVVVAMSIGADGQVSRTSVQRNTTGNETLGTCLSSQVGTWRLPPPPGGSLDMTMPFSR